MARKNPNAEATRNFTPLNAGGLIDRVVRRASAAESTPTPETAPPIDATPPTEEPLSEERRPIDHEISSVSATPPGEGQTAPRRREPTQRIRFDLSEADYEELLETLRDIQRVTGRFDITNFLRAAVTRAITARRELVDAAQAFADKHGKLKKPNTRDASAVAFVDHALFQIQASAFRRTPRFSASGGDSE